MPLKKMPVKHLKTWVEIRKKAVEKNVKTFRDLVGKKTRLWAVVKSNAYGHGLAVFSRVADKAGADGFCVDNVKEGAELRANGISKPILVLGPTLPALFKEARENKITITISNKDALKSYLKNAAKPDFHLKIDSGMHRQGFYPEEMPGAISSLKKVKDHFKGVYTHFCAASDINYPVYTEMQFKNFNKALSALEGAGFKDLIKHAAATGGTLMNKKYHLDAVRIGIGFYGLWPSKELNVQFRKIGLEPVFSWHALVSEVKNIKKGDCVGYDLAEKAVRNGKVAVIPIGYWHGFPRALSSVGRILIGGKPAKVLGRVSMDLIVADITGTNCAAGSEAVIVGKQAGEEIFAADVAGQTGTNHYEFITRVNPLIERIIK